MHDTRTHIAAALKKFGFCDYPVAAPEDSERDQKTVEECETLLAATRLTNRLGI